MPRLLSAVGVTGRQRQSPLSGFLQVAAVLAYGCWGWAAHPGTTRWAWALGALFAAWIIWDVFRVPGDGATRPAVPIPGWVRLIIEAAYFTGVATALVSIGLQAVGIVYIILVAMHYTLTHRRLVWLLREGESTADG